MLFVVRSNVFCGSELMITLGKHGSAVENAPAGEAVSVNEDAPVGEDVPVKDVSAN